ncbi:DUF1223 domain-containing protein [Spongiivirga citrea]|uniref:DUF1223 domain-containing protein n=1 Tax=Spongiivirga citrea TaxID=1481457 RepID=A0A6M0CGA4_9FLAO|nr:DUF1223 domain-containing protein [Spongiivirga citrea]NER15923.1 DUF1223 domain-containing protein [Spongiivirga citrea]
MQKILFRIVLAAVLVIGVVFVSNAQASNKDKMTIKGEPVILLELFTSQGCSSCPPADELLSEISETYNNKKVFTLSYHVDYWNYIGWKDPFSSKKYSDKQRLYAQKFRSRSIYTPQLVVNGSEHFVGSSETKLKSAIKRYSENYQSDQNIVIKSLKRNGNTVEASYTFNGDSDSKNLRAVLVVKEKTTHIKRGENRNLTLTNKNIVAAEVGAKLITEATVSLQIPSWIENSDELSLILIAEDENLTTLTAVASKISK